MSDKKQAVMAEEQQTVKRENWGSRVGFILSSLGMAIGVGAVWRFPMMTAQNGGGAFVLAFVIIGFVIVVPAAWAETALGRKYKLSIMGTFGAVAGKKGTVFGFFTSLIPIGLLAYYPIIIGIIINYIFYTIMGAPFLNDVAGFYNQINDNRIGSFLCLVGIIAVTAFISLKGIQKGIEKCCKVMLPIMFIFILIVCIRVVTLDGISVGIKFYLAPDFSQLLSADLWLAAAGMALFAIGVGPGFLPTYGSYLDEKADIATDFLIVNCTNVLTCLLCGFAIIPAVVLFGLDATAGKGVLFQSMPLVFSELPGGMIWFLLFMTALLFAGISTTIAQMEIPVSSFMDGFNMSRPKAILIVSVSAILLAIPCVWSDAFFAFFDNLVGNVFYCVTAGVTSLYIAWFYGARKVREELYNPTSIIQYGSWVDVAYKYLSVPAFVYFGITAVLSLF